MTASRPLPWAARKLWAMRRDLFAARLQVHKLSFFIHDFMDAGCFDCDRVDACVFSVATAEGPVSMCLHNAKRDAYILPPPVADGPGWWDPLTGAVSATKPRGRPVQNGPKTLNGRLKAACVAGAP